MEDAMMDRLRIASDLQARIRRVEDAAVEYALACEACAQKAGEASAWCKGEDSAVVLRSPEHRADEISTVRSGRSHHSPQPQSSRFHAAAQTACFG